VGLPRRSDSRRGKTVARRAPAGRGGGWGGPSAGAASCQSPADLDAGGESGPPPSDALAAVLRPDVSRDAHSRVAAAPPPSRSVRARRLPQRAVGAMGDPGRARPV